VQEKEVAMMQHLNVSGTGAAAEATPIAATCVENYSRAAVQLSGTWSATVTFECSVDGTNWVSLEMQMGGTSGNTSTTTTANGIFWCPLACRYFRARISDYTSGTVVATALFADKASLVLPSGLTSQACTILSGASLSDAVKCLNAIPVGVLLPDTWTAAVMTFQVSLDNSNWYNLYDKIGEVLYPAAASEYLALDPTQFAGARYLKVRSGTNGTPVNQAADRSLTVILRSLA
jgi:hypothetical protein